MRSIKYLVILSIFIVTSALFISSCQNKIDQTTAIKTSESEKAEESKVQSQTTESSFPKAPMFSGINLVDGKQFSLENMKDHVLIIDFWAPWCPPCRAEIPGFIELHNKYQDKKFAVIGIVVSARESDTKKYITEQNVNYPIIMGTEKIVKEYELAIQQPIQAIPTTLVVNRKGEIVKVHIGAENKSKFEKEILELF